MKIDAKREWLQGVRIVPSPNYNTRNAEIDMLVIHGISLPPGEFGGRYIDCLFTNTLEPNAHPSFVELSQLRVSSHILIDRLGRITQYVPLTSCAWHAGESEFQGRSGCNDFSIGVELEGCDWSSYSQPQYHSLAEFTDCVCRTWQAIRKDRIVGHSEIAPMRKTDPGPGFDWDYYFSLCHGMT